MHRWKYQGERRLAKTTAKIMLNASKYPAYADMMLPTPLYWQRQLRRGFNQSHDLLEALCQLQPALRGTPSARLARRRATVPQAGASRQERLRNLEGAFAVHGDVSHQRITLIDDVCTTGATANAMAKTLLDAGAAEVHLWCFARTPAS
jgi:ComF family protein